MKESESESRSVTFDSLQPHGTSPARILCPWNSPGKNAGVASHSLLQAIFPTRGLKPDLLHCRQEREREWLRLRRIVHMCSKTVLNHPNPLAISALECCSSAGWLPHKHLGENMLLLLACIWTRSSDFFSVSGTMESGWQWEQLMTFS